MTRDDKRRDANELAREALDRGDATGWFEVLYAGAGQDADAIPWADLKPHPGFDHWLTFTDLLAAGKRAVVVGCGLGDDAEALAAKGFEVTAFDVSPSAVEWASKRVPDSVVSYRVADLLDLPEEWERGFDLVAEVYTLQSLPASVRRDAIEAVARLVAPGGTLVVVCRARESEEPAPGPPWHLTREELGAFEHLGLEQVSFVDYIDGEEPTVRRFRIEYRRPAG
jgi:SAM-dependent methyltransferase